MKLNNHYFINSELVHDRKEISFRFFDNDFTFITDRGVFSKDKVDVGTQVLLTALMQADLSDSLLDLGCGYGVIGIVLKKIYPALNITALDINQRAIVLTQENYRRNKLVADVLISDGLAAIQSQFFQHITLNPPIKAGKEVIYRLFQESFQQLKKGGNFWFVMKKNHGLPSAIKYAESLFAEVTKVFKKHDYTVIRCTK